MKERIYKIRTEDGREFVTNCTADLARVPFGSTITVGEMTHEDYHAVPATPESAAFFGVTKEVPRE